MFEFLRRLGASSKEGAGRSGGSDPLQRSTLRDPLEPDPGLEEKIDGRLSSLGVDEILRDYREPFRQVLTEALDVAPLEFVEAREHGVAPKALYERFLRAGAPSEINLHSSQRQALDRLAGEGKYEEMDLSAAIGVARYDMSSHVGELKGNRDARERMRAQVQPQKKLEVKGPDGGSGASKQGKPGATKPSATKEPAPLSGLSALLHRTFNTGTWKKHKEAEDKQKAAKAEQERQAAEEREKSIIHALSTLDPEVALRDFGDLLRSRAEAVNSAELFELIDAVDGGADNQTLYRDFFAPGAPSEVNIAGSVRNKLVVLAQAGLWDAMDMGEALAEAKGNLYDMQCRLYEDPEAVERMSRRM